MRHYYYTICSKDTLYKSLVLYETMKENDLDFKFYVFCKEEECVGLIKRLNPVDMVPIGFSDLADKEMVTLGAKAAGAHFLFERYAEIDHALCLDCEIALLSDTNALYDLWGNASVLLMENTADARECNRTASIIGFKKDREGISCLNRILEIYNDAHITDAEQMGMDAVIESIKKYEQEPKEQLYNENVFVLGSYDRHLTDRDLLKSSRKGIYLNGKKVMMFHYAGLKYIDGKHYDLSSKACEINNRYIKPIYMPYLERCNQAIQRLLSLEPDYIQGESLKGLYIGNYFNYFTNLKAAQSPYHLCTLCSSECLVQLLTLYHSIKKYQSKFTLWVCCLDDDSYDYLHRSSLKGLELLHRENMLGKTGLEQSKNENVTCFVSNILKNNFAMESLLYIEPDYYFFENPKYIFDKMNKSVPNNLNENLRCQLDANSSMLGFRRNGKNNEVLEGADCISNFVVFHVSSEANKTEKAIYGSKNEWNSTSLKNIRITTVGSKVLANNKSLIAIHFKNRYTKEMNFSNFAKEIINNNAAAYRTVYSSYLKTLRICLDSIKNFK